MSKIYSIKTLYNEITYECICKYNFQYTTSYTLIDKFADEIQMDKINGWLCPF